MVGAAALVEVCGGFSCVRPNRSGLQLSSWEMTRLQIIMEGVCFAEMICLSAGVVVREQQIEINLIDTRWQHPADEVDKHCG